MAANLNLTQASIMSRKGIRFAIYALIFLIIARFAYAGGSSIYRKMFPPPPPKPTVKFEKLPAVPFPEFDSEKAARLTYKLETVTGSLPKISDQAIVYFMPKAVSSILSVDKASQIAGRLGFNPEGRELVKTVYEFSHPTNPSKLNMNIVNGIFSISYDLNSDPQVFNGIPPTAGVATENGKAFLKSGDILPNDILPEDAKHQLLKLGGGKFVEAIALNDAQFTKVNFFRKPYPSIKEDLPSVTPNFDEANVWFIYSSDSKRQNKIISGEYHYYPVDEKTNSTYPLKSVEKAWEDLTTGKGYVAKFGESNEVVIRDIYLAYFDPGQYSEFYQPVFVFEDGNGFAAYVPAVTEEFYGAETIN